MRLHVKKFNTTEFLIFFLIALNLSVLKVFPFVTKAVVHYVTFGTVVGMFAMIVLSKKRIGKYYKDLYIYLLLFFGVETIYTIIRYNYGVVDVFYELYPFAYLLLSPIIVERLNKHKGFYETLIRFIILATTISFIMRITLSYVYSLTGSYIFSDMAFEFNSGEWKRNSVLRVNAPCFIIYYVPLVWYGYYKKLVSKLKTATCFGIYFYYLFMVIQTRSMIVYSIIVFSYLMLFQDITGLKRVITYLATVGGVLFFIRSDFFETLFYSLFHGGGRMGTSIFDRLSTCIYFFNWFFENPFLGIGLLRNDALHANLIAGHISDIGILGNICKFGLFFLPVYLAYFLRWIMIAQKIGAQKKTESLFICSIIISVILFGINIDCFYGMVIFSFPVISSIIEYIGQQQNKTAVINTNL